MLVKHFPKLDTEAAIKAYQEKDGVDIKYVCTTELSNYGFAYDIFYRSTPHPTFGNRYFGLRGFCEYTFGPSYTYIVNADGVEDFTFACIENNIGEWTYSQHTHDFVSWGNGFIDGGRAYTRTGGTTIPDVKYFKVRDGDFVIG